MAIDVLFKVLPPPLAPEEAAIGSSEDWPQIEKRLGTALPSDYREYITSYGSGQIGEFLWVYNALSKDPYLNLFKQGLSILNALRDLQEKWGADECPYSLYPKAGGLLTWGYTDNGDELFWLTSGDPSQWSIVIHESRTANYEQHPGPMTRFLAGLITGEMVSAIIPTDTINKNALFIPISQIRA